jgi:O-methyltransferase involved in polyketide biosynthesis
VTESSTATGGKQPAPEIDTSVPHSARIWNYWLGGKDNFAVDREAGDQYRQVFPYIFDIARQSRAFLIRAVTFLAGEAGVRQFLDIGTGLPTANNTHEVAQRIARECRIVYVDNDPLVLAHARALLVGTPEGATQYVDADLREPDRIVQKAAETLDFTKPIALMLMGIMGHMTDEEAPSIVKRLVDALPSGSYLSLNDGTDTNEALNAAQRGYNESGAVPYYLRSPEQIASFFEGLELVPPGVVPVTQWRPDPETAEAAPPETYGAGAVGRKP